MLAAQSFTAAASQWLVRELFRITVLKSGFTREWVERLREDMMTAFWEAIQRPGGAVARGRRRWYVEVHPQAISGFVDLVSGTVHASPIARPVLVLGVDAPGAGHAALHDMMVTPGFYDTLPRALRDHLVCRVVDQLVPVTQKHDIQGLL